MKVTLLHHSPLWLASNAIRFSHDNHDKSDTVQERLCPSCDSCDFEFLPQPLDYYKCNNCNAEFTTTKYNKQSGPKDLAIIARVGNKMKHKSVLEQLVYWFDIDGISRACLQELARHRTARLTVKSSRYTLNELKSAKSMWFDAPRDCDYETGYKFLVKTGNIQLDSANILQLGILQGHLARSTSNDIVKYMLPEAFKTKLQWQIDGRNIQSFLELRSSKDALWEIRLLARAIFDALPEEHKYLYEEYMKDN